MILSGGTTIAKAIEFIGTQNAINAIVDSIYVPVDGTSGSLVHATGQGNVQVNYNFGAGIDPYPTVRMDAHIIDHKGFKSIRPVCRQTNFIVTHEGVIIEDHQGNELIFIEP